jgi:hypothetical protein
VKNAPDHTTTCSNGFTCNFQGKLVGAFKKAVLRCLKVEDGLRHPSEEDDPRTQYSLTNIFRFGTTDQPGVIAEVQDRLAMNCCMSSAKRGLLGVGGSLANTFGKSKMDQHI